MSAKSQETTYDHVLKYTGLFGGVQGLNMFIGIVRTKIVAILLGPEGLALINIFNNVMKLMYEMTTFGVSFSAVKHIAEINADDDGLRRYVSVVRTWSLATGLLGMLLTLLSAPLLSKLTFMNFDYSLSFVLLAPVALCMALSGGEMAILKGVKELKRVAIVSFLSTLCIFLLCVPIYWFFGMDGVAMSLLLSNAAILLIQLRFSTELFPWRASIFSKESYMEGVPMIKLGLGYIVAGIFGQGAEYIIRAMIIRFGELADVGLYNSGYVMAVTYAGVVFIAIEADYFPRLSAAKEHKAQQNFAVNQQIEVCVLLIAPCLIMFVTAMPIIVQLLFSDKFVEAIPMAVCASMFMFFKALTLPAAYLSLAHGDSQVYMTTELVYDIVVAVLVPLAFQTYGLMGCGVALSIGGLIDMIMIHGLYSRLYQYRFGTKRLPFYFTQFVLLLVTIIASLNCGSIVTWSVGIACFIVSATMSLRILKHETHLFDKFKKVRA